MVCAKDIEELEERIKIEDLYTYIPTVINFSHNQRVKNDLPVTIKSKNFITDTIIFNIGSWGLLTYNNNLVASPSAVTIDFIPEHYGIVLWGLALNQTDNNILIVPVFVAEKNNNFKLFPLTSIETTNSSGGTFSYVIYTPETIKGTAQYTIDLYGNQIYQDSQYQRAQYRTYCTLTLSNEERDFSAGLENEYEFIDYETYKQLIEGDIIND